MADLSSKTLSIVSSPGANEDHPKEVSFDNWVKGFGEEQLQVTLSVLK